MNAKNPPNHRGVRTVTEVSATLVEQMIFRVQPPVAVRLTPQGVRISVEKMWENEGWCASVGTFHEGWMKNVKTKLPEYMNIPPPPN